MSYSLCEINTKAKNDPSGFIEECDEVYREKISRAADMIIDNFKNSPIVLLSGPSGSGKTTTALKIEEELEKRGLLSHSIAMDNYFRTVIPGSSPLTPEGDLDFESPLCVDMELLNEHFTLLSQGKTINVPKFKFSNRSRAEEPSKILRLRKDEIAIFEGIHALNDEITNVHPEAFKLYISARSNVFDGDRMVFKGTWMRLVRRTVRDSLFRGAGANETLGMWANVRRGEKNYISPFKDKANLKFDSSFPYEVSVMKSHALALFSSVSEKIERFDELCSILPAFDIFENIDSGLLAPDSLLREFIGGGSYKY